VKTLEREIEQLVQEGKMGATVLLVRHGEQFWVDRAFGKLAPGGPPMSRDAIFRITSLTKPIVAAAALGLVDERRLQLGDPVSRYVPEFVEADKRTSGASTTIRDLLRHTAGFADYQDPAVNDLLEKSPSSAEFARALALLPRLEPPGTKFRYGPAYEVLGRVIEVVSGESLDSYLQRALFEPLGMRDTHFVVPASKRSRIPAVVSLRNDRLAAVQPAGREPAEGTRYLSGGGGLRSTSADLMRFARMLVAGGVVGGHRVLSADSVRMMTSDQLQQLTPWREEGLSWGLGFQVSAEPLTLPRRAFGWEGFFGTTLWVAPETGLIVIALLQQTPAHRPGIEYRVRSLVTGSKKR
jgi:CubicO group peptidase (beta-lactamase class C family)